MGLSPAAIVPIILNFLPFFLLNFFVSLEAKAYPSNAELFDEGSSEGEKMSFALTLFKELLIEISSTGY